MEKKIWKNRIEREIMLTTAYLPLFMFSIFGYDNMLNKTTEINVCFRVDFIENHSTKHFSIQKYLSNDFGNYPQSANSISILKICVPKKYIFGERIKHFIYFRFTFRVCVCVCAIFPDSENEWENSSFNACNPKINRLS